MGPLEPAEDWRTLRLTQLFGSRVFQEKVYFHTSPHLKAVSNWELEAWYEDLQEVLSSDENGGNYISPPGNEENQKHSPLLTLHLLLG
ncbi:DNA damage-inducible transcript 3 protein isoform X3 [Heterocephalus glaber]|uniref:DNA damage-inducible transcript 3 protein isoform X3 n=1 Tax=Heterocephalus glaber TaxID=10181 RepID=A0AAX6R2R6_HETGA|nr:DNA damage-inducible transcript 3 protein isoform X3 [Heterocephalus glaber]